MAPTKKRSRKGAKASSHQIDLLQFVAKSTSKKEQRDCAVKPVAIADNVSTSMPRTRNQHAIADCKIFMLNDDCLLEVFSYFPTIELCPIKNVCRRFSAQADWIVERRFEKNTFILGNFVDYNEMKVIFQHYGKFVNDVLFMNGTHSNVDDKWSLLKYCTALGLLRISAESNNRLPIHQLKKVLRNLEQLCYYSVGAHDDLNFGRIVRACKNVKRLVLISEKTINGEIPFLKENMADLRGLTKLESLDSRHCCTG